MPSLGVALRFRRHWNRFEHSYGHPNLGSGPAVGQIKKVVGAQGQGKGSIERAGMDVLFTVLYLYAVLRQVETSM